MTSEAEHMETVKELLDDISEKVRSGLIVERQKIVGFSASEASCNIFALLLHKKRLITPGFNVNHRFFASEKMANEYFRFSFPEKAALLLLLVEQEKYRNLLCYGKGKERKVVEGAIENVQKIRDMVEKLIGEDI